LHTFSGLIIDVQRWDHTLGNHPGAELTGRTSADAAIEDQLHLAGSADVQVLADDFFEEHAAGYWPIQHLGERELRL
jgi:hypothetical protein